MQQDFQNFIAQKREPIMEILYIYFGEDEKQARGPKQNGDGSGACNTRVRRSWVKSTRYSGGW